MAADFAIPLYESGLNGQTIRKCTIEVVHPHSARRSTTVEDFGEVITHSSLFTSVRQREQALASVTRAAMLKAKA